MDKSVNNVTSWIVFFLVLSALTAKKVVSIIKTKEDFKRALLPKAREIESRTGMKADVAIGQAALESGWGQSLLTREGNNLFGMMAGPDWIKAYLGKGSFDVVPAWTTLPASTEANGSNTPAGRNVLWLPTKEFAPGKTPEQIKYWEIPGDVIGKNAEASGTWLTVRRPFRRYANLNESLEDWSKKISTLSRYADAFAAARAGDPKSYGAALSRGGYATDPKYPEKILASIQAVQGIEIPPTAVV